MSTTSLLATLSELAPGAAEEIEKKIADTRRGAELLALDHHVASLEWEPTDAEVLSGLESAVVHFTAGTFAATYAVLRDKVLPLGSLDSETRARIGAHAQARIAAEVHRVLVDVDRRLLVQDLVARGVPMRPAGAAVGLTGGRVCQLLND